MSRARDFTRAQAMRSHAPRRPHSPSTRFTRGHSLSLHLRASISASSLLSPSLSFNRPLLQARARVPIAAVAQTCRPRPGEGPVQPDPERAGGGKAERRGRPGRGGRGRRGSPGTPFSPHPQPLSPNSNLPAPLGPHSLPTPLPTELLKFATCSPSPRRGSSPGSRDSPPGCGRRCPVPDGSRLQERWRRTRRTGRGSGNGAAAQGRPPGPRLGARVQSRPGSAPTTLGISSSRWMRG